MASSNDATDIGAVTHAFEEREGSSPVEEAAAIGHVEILEFLWQIRAFPIRRDPARTLYAAAENGDAVPYSPPGSTAIATLCFPILPSV